jgi:diguanylate cyclase (GGDEF)-like protein
VRYGGEEFCILLPNVALDQATLMAERAREAVEKARFDHAGKFIPVTISLGIAGLLRSGHDSIERLVGRADEALYSAKRGGRNRVVAYPESSTLAMVMRSQNA